MSRSSELPKVGGELNRPLIMVDVDGVLNVITSSSERRRLCYHEGWRQKRVELPVGAFRLFWNPASGPALRRLAAETGAELAWGTTWEEYANLVVGPLVGLPTLPVCPVADFPHKATGIVPWTAGRPFVWFDDEPDAGGVCARIAGTQPHLVVPVDECEGLTEQHVATARSWLLAVKEGGPPCPSCSRGENGGGYPCDCPAACGARYCQHPTETTTEERRDRDA